ncbi:MAG: rane protein [Candidatus Saccharibacteria bacterium]|nr:rane protein [Candidatus Saccharibacteria bacterium]
MLKKLKYIIAGLSLAIIPALAVSYVSADAAQDSVCQGIGLVSSTGGCVEDASSPSVGGTVHAVVTILSWVVGVLSVIMVIVGGFKYITSGGDSTKVGSAKNTILYAVVGLVIVAMAQVIVRFTINKTSGTNNPVTPVSAPVTPPSQTPS